MDPIIRTIVVDDELYSRDELKHLLKEYAHIQVIGEANSGESAVMKVIQLQPDVIFLDIEMPKMNGMEVAKSLKELKKSPILVFTTAYPDFAAKAFRYEALDYLLKPYDEDQLQETIQRLGKALHQPKKVEDQTRNGKLALDGSSGIVYIEPKDILYISHEEKASKIISTSGEYLTKTPLKELESRLKSYSFFRIHKSYLVNLDYIKGLTPWFNGAYQLELAGVQEQLAVSRNYVKALRARLEI